MCFLIQVFLMVIYANCNFGNGLHGLIKNETSMDSMLIYRREMYGPAGPPVNGPGDPIKPMAGDDPSMASIIAMDTYIPLRYLFPYWSYGHRVFLITTTARYNRGSVAVGPAAAQDKPGGLLGFNNKLNKRQRTDRMNLNFYDCNLVCPKFYEHYGKVCGRRQIHTIKNFTYVIQTFKNLCKLEHANCQSDISRPSK